jgi:hypothetical protein
VSQEFLELAKRNAVDYVVNPNVSAIVVTGSVARGTADRNSDVDTIVFVESACPRDEFEKECRRAVESGGCLYGGTPEAGFALFRYSNGVRCDIVFDLVSSMEARLDQVLDRYCIDERKQLMIRSVRESVVLYGQDLVDTWRRRSDHYPDGLAFEMISQNLNTTPRWVLQKMGADRDEKLFVYDCFMQNVKRMFGVLLGLNQTYHPAKLKSIRRVAAKFPLAPPEFCARAEALFDTPLDVAVGDYARLFEEVLGLLEKHRSDIDVDRARELFNKTLAADQRFKAE